jgi:hypothetical protein
VRCVTTLSEWKRRAGAKKDFESEHSCVFAAPGSLLAHFLTGESGMNKENVTISSCRFIGRRRNGGLTQGAGMTRKKEISPPKHYQPQHRLLYGATRTISFAEIVPMQKPNERFGSGLRQFVGGRRNVGGS